MAYMKSGKELAESKAKLGSGGRFAAVQGSVAQEYEKKGMSPAKAKAIGGAVAAKAGREKYGAKKFNKLGADARK